MKQTFNSNEYKRTYSKEHYSTFKVDIKKEEKKELDDMLEKKGISKAQFLRDAIIDLKKRGKFKMKKIRAYVNYNDESKTHYYKDFEIIENLPELETEAIKNEKYKNCDSLLEKIETVELDCEQGTDEVYKYDFYKLTYFNNMDHFENEYEDDECESERYVAILKEDIEYMVTCITFENEKISNEEFDYPLNNLEFQPTLDEIRNAYGKGWEYVEEVYVSKLVNGEIVSENRLK